jgi:hypothetical protein
MPNESDTHSEVVTKTYRVFRYAVGVTLALTIVLLIIDLGLVLLLTGRGANVNVYLSQNVLMTIILAIAGEAVVATVALVCLARWGRQQPQ